MKEQVESQCEAALRPGAEPDALDDYLLEVNSFYYQSFARGFIPQFRQLLAEDIRNLYHIRQQDEARKRSILTTIRQQARLYNQVKNITSLLKGKRQEIQSLELSALRSSEERSVGLLYIWKDYAQNWNSFLCGLRNLQNFLDDHKMMAALNQYPAHAVVSALLYSWEPQNTKAGRDLNRLLATWQLAIKLLAKFIDDPPTSKDAGRLLSNELEKIDTSWDNRKSPTLLRTWYRQHIQKTYRLHLGLLRLGGDKNDRQLAVQASTQLHDWLQALLYVAEKGLASQDQGSRDLISNPYLLTGIDPEYLQEMTVYCARMLQDAEDSIHGLTNSTRAQYSNYSQRCGQVLADNGQYLRLQLDTKVKTQAILLTSSLDNLKNQLDRLENRLEILDEQEAHTAQLQSSYQLLVTSLDSYLELLQSIQEELMRLLSPRNLKRIFTDMDISVEHLAIAAGASFPGTHHNLIDEVLVKTQVGPEPEGRILSTAGDIFIIRLDDLEEREIPAIIIAKKG